MFHTVFTGHLTDDARFNTFEDKGVINFTIAVNFPTGKKDEQGNYIEEAQFFQCSRWLRDSKTPKVLDYLKKGKKVIVEANKIAVKTTEVEGKIYNNLVVNVERLELGYEVQPKKESE